MEEIKNQDKNDSNLSKETYQPETESGKKEQGKIKKYFSSLPKRYFITAFSGMAQGLFVTLIAGTILAQIAGRIGDNYVGNALGNIAAIAKTLMGAGIGVGIAHALQKNKLLVFSAAVAGFAGAFADKLLPSSTAFALTLGAPGNPIGSYVVTMLVVEVVGLYAGKTKLDILIVPLGTLLLSFCGVFLSFPFIWLIDELGELIAIATNATPFVMGIVISVIIGHTAYHAHLFRRHLGHGFVRHNFRVRGGGGQSGSVRGNFTCRRRRYRGMRLPHGGIRRRVLPRK